MALPFAMFMTRGRSLAPPNSLITTDCYVPIVKSRQGELRALGLLSGDKRTTLVPLVEVRDTARQGGSLATAWSDPAHVLFVQPLNFDGRDEQQWAEDVLSLFDELRNAAVSAVPVATTDDSPAVRAVLAQVIEQDDRGGCLRLDAEEIALATPAALAAEVDELVGDLGLAATRCDFVLDVGLVRSSVVARVATAEAGLRVVPNIGAWRNLVCAFSAFPENLSEVAPINNVSQILREDAIAFATLLSRQPERDPVYADYCVGFPFYIDSPWIPIPAIRYAVDDSWMVHRGSSRQNRSTQYVQLASDVVQAPYFAGAGFSPGDRYLADVAVGSDGPGNPMTYVRAATSRHIACVLDRLANHGVP